MPSYRYQCRMMEVVTMAVSIDRLLGLSRFVCIFGVADIDNQIAIQYMLQIAEKVEI